MRIDKLRSYTWLAVTAVFAICLVTFTLSDIVTQPWNEIPELGGDGAKNIFTYLYQSTQGHGYWFQGLNYPYGEHIVYTDGQPALSMLLSSFKGMTTDRALTILWWLIGAGYVVSIVYLFKILRWFKVGPLAAMLFAGLTGIFTPQIQRLQGHYALSYTCIIPMLFYWTIRHRESGHWRYPVYFFITGCIAAFMHPYYAALMLVWVVVYSISYWLFTKGKVVEKARAVAPLLMAVGAVLAVVAVVMKLTDPVTDRPVTPFNTLYETCTRLKQLVTSYKSPVWQTLQHTKLWRYVSDGGEGYAYVGVVTMLTVGCMLLAVALKTMRAKKLQTDAGVGFPKMWLFMGFAVLLFGMGIPFVWHMEGLMNYLAIFKQFRSLGRFSWIFYYIISVYTVVTIYGLFQRLKQQGRAAAGYAIIIGTLALWSYEASGYISNARMLSRYGLYNHDMMFSTHEQKWSEFLVEHHYKQDNFQAILLLPFFHVGTEKLWVGYGNWLITLGSKAALQLHLPIIDVMMSRSSWGQAKQQVKIAAGGFVDKPILHDIKSDKPFLLMRFDEDTLNEDQKYLLEASDYLGHYSQCYVYACYPARLAANDRRNRERISAILPYMKGQDTVVGGTASCFIEHLGDAGAPHVFGSGGAAAIGQDSALITTIRVTPPADSQLYEFSAWFLLGDKDPRAPNIVLELIDASGKKDTTADVLTRQSTDNKGMWFRAGKYFYLHHNIITIKCKIMNFPRPTYIAMDELLLRPADATVISKDREGRVMVNNHLFK